MLLMYIDAKTMELHYASNLQNYIDNLNRLLEDQPTLQMMPLDQLIITAQQMRVSVGRPILRNAGGIFNHTMFFNGMTPPIPGNSPEGALLSAIQKAYINVENTLKRLKAAAMSVFGSGYACLARGGSKWKCRNDYHCEPRNTASNGSLSFA